MQLAVLIGLIFAATMSATTATNVNVTGEHVNNTNDFTTGFSFTTTQTFTIIALDYYDSGQDGLLDSHDVAIWTSTGTQLLSATVPSGTTTPLNNIYRSIPIAPFTLLPGSYVIGGDSFDSSDPITQTLTFTSLVGLTVTDDTDFVFASTLSFPTSTGGAQYMNANFEVMPEPATYALAGLGLATAAFLRRKRVQ